VSKFGKKLGKVRNLIRNPNENESNAARNRFKEMKAGRKTAMAGPRASVRAAQAAIANAANRRTSDRFKSGSRFRATMARGPMQGPKQQRKGAKGSRASAGGGG
jgi:hypothetical protein